MHITHKELIDICSKRITQRADTKLCEHSSRIFVPVRSNRHNVMQFVPENAILLMSLLKLIVPAAVLRKSVTSIVASL